MLRAASSSLARAAVRHSRGGGSNKLAPSIQSLTFHTTPPREDESSTTPATTPKPKGGILGTGIDEWYALPVGIAASIPLIKYDWYVINEETQLMAAFVAFCVICYTQGGDAVYNFLNDKAETMLKEQRESEQGLIDSMEELLEKLHGQLEIPELMGEMNVLRGEAYAKLAAAGAIKPKHDLKVQVERVLNMIAQEEANVMEKTKVALMEEATASVSEKFTSSKALKKAALDAAIATMKDGSAKADPVQAEFVKFFQEKAAAAKKSTDDGEEKAQRAAFLAKANALAESEGFFFRFDESGMPKLVA